MNKLYLSISCILITFATGKNTFLMSFQGEIEGPEQASNDAWIEFSNAIPSAKEFTSCFWMKLRFYNFKYAACLWSYCTVQNLGNKMKCLRICLKGITESGNRDLAIAVQIPSNTAAKDISVNINPYIHRTWGHFCWSFSAINGENKFYYNGILIGIEIITVVNIDVAMHDANKAQEGTLLFGQEPDIMRGEFDKREAFLGDLSELNFWNYTLNDRAIKDLALCKSWLEGNIVSWDISTMIVHNVTLIKLSKPNTLCSNSPQYAIFPQKVRYPEAKAICKIHGGELVVPKSEQENNKVMNIVLKHKGACIEKGNLSDGNAVWIGATKIDRQ